MLAVWGAFILLFAIVSLYISHLAKYEKEQLFLGDSMSRVKSEQQAITARVQKVEPFRKVTLALAAAMTLFVIGYYILTIIRQFQ